jgi:outer membrane immunogenic protein
MGLLGLLGEKKMRQLVFGIAALIIGAASPVLAADLRVKMPVKAPPLAAPVYNWTGFYIGGAIGGTWADVNRTGLDAEDFTSSDSSQISGGVYAGYNWQVNSSIVLGLEADGTWLNTAFEGDHGGSEWDYVKLDWAVTFSGRAGVLLTPTMLLYGKVGVTRVQTRLDNWGQNFLTSIEDGNRTGIQVGGGLETFVQPNFLVRIEGLYTKLNDDVAANYGDLRYSFEPEFFTVRVGGAFKF